MTATNGQVGGFLHTNVAPLLPRPVLYIGDLDMRGADIEGNTRRVLEGAVGPPDWTRVALTQAQVTHYAVPVVMKQDDAKGGAYPAVEVERWGRASGRGSRGRRSTRSCPSRSKPYRYTNRNSTSGSGGSWLNGTRRAPDASSPAARAPGRTRADQGARAMRLRPQAERDQAIKDLIACVTYVLADRVTPDEPHELPVIDDREGDVDAE